MTEFIETVGRIAAGASVVDPSLVSELIRRSGGMTRWMRCHRGSGRCWP